MVLQSATQTGTQLTFGLLADRPVVVQSTDARLSSDAGLLPLREFDRQCRLTERMASLLMWTARKYVEPYSHAKSPHKFTQAQLMSCLELRAYLKTTYRRSHTP